MPLDDKMEITVHRCHGDAYMSKTPRKPRKTSGVKKPALTAEQESKVLRIEGQIRELAQEAGVKVTISGARGQPKTPPDARAAFARNVRQAMDKAGMSLGDLSETSGIRYLTLVSYRDGKRIPRSDHLDAFASALGITVEVLMDGVRK